MKLKIQTVILTLLRIIIKYNLGNQQMLSRIFRCNFALIKSLDPRVGKEKSQSSYLGMNYLTYNSKIDFSKLQSIDLSSLKIQYNDDNQNFQTVPQLEHGLDKFLNGELVFGSQGVGRFPQNKQNLTSQILHRMSNYYPPEKDEMLLRKNKEHNCKYISSTSNISQPLMKLYFLVSCFRMPKLDNILGNSSVTHYMISYRKPTTFFLSHIGNGQRAIVSDHGLLNIQNRVLMDLGHVVQYFLTHKRQETEKMLLGKIEQTVQNYYRYAIINDQILVRSQIDCRSVDENGKDYVFEIKSRACAPIRYDIQNYKDYVDYEIKQKRGIVESFERQYYDLIRGGFLKYAFQIKIGRMDGAFIAYHNTQKIYGYEYVKLKQMALRCFGNQFNFDVHFKLSSKMLTIVLDEIRSQLAQFEEYQYKIGFYADCQTKKFIVMIQVLSEVKQYQNNSELNDIFEYFKLKPLKNPVFRIFFNFHIFLNNTLFNDREVLLSEHDSLQIKWQASKKQRVATNDYLAFLHQAYKMQEVFSNEKYRGNWE